MLNDLWSKLFDFSSAIALGKMEDVKMQQRTVIRFLTLEGAAPNQILERLQKVYREEALPSDQVEYWATEFNDERRRFPLPMLLRNTDVMADVLGFLPRKVIALKLAAVNVAFSTLCNCWCQMEKEKADDDGCDAETASVGDKSAVPASPAFENGQQQRKRKLDRGSKSKK